MRAKLLWRFLLTLSLLAGLPGLGAWTALSAPASSQPHDQYTITLDGVMDSSYVLIASDPDGDLADPGPANWVGVAWTDLTGLYVTADSSNLYVYIPSPDYSQAVSTGQFALAIETDGAVLSGGATDPWGNAIGFLFDTVDGFGYDDPFHPDYMIRGNIVGQEGSNGWTELRTWNGNWDTGAGSNWGGISSGQVGTHFALADGQGLEFAIPLADIGSPNLNDIRLHFLATQSGGGKGAYDTVPSDDQSTGWDDPTTQTQLASVPLAIDPAGDLADPGPANWNGVTWTDQTRLHAWADWDSLNLYLPMPEYDTSVSTGQIGLTIGTQPGGGSGDPWGNAISLVYTTTFQNLGVTPVVTTSTLPDYFIRGNIYGASDNGWTELRSWNGSDWNTGGGVDWGGIGNSGVGSLPGSNIAWTDGDGLRVTIPFADIAVTAGDTVHLQFFGTQSGGGKGTYDTVPADDQSTGWDDPTTQLVVASYTIPSVPEPGAAHDNNIYWDDLLHDSRDPLYRTPGGPVITETDVTLRLRAASGDLTGARVRVWNDRFDQQSFFDMTLAADDGDYEYWQVTLPGSDLPTVYWYRFIALDGTAVAYYEDDALRTGGVGQPFVESQDYSWQLTIYDENFSTPDWVKNAIFYQIFTDRFADGDSTNNTPAGTFFYNETGGTIERSNQADWNTFVCDPRGAAPGCEGTYSKNFYGGDLQGVIDKLDYLEELGITAIYFNPLFESPSNHKYDATDYSIIDDNFGDLATFQTLATEAQARGIEIILDGVFNHVSSDSIYFDRYGRYPEVGACESPTSPYRAWFFFTDVGAGNGACVASDGTPNAANYTSWFGFDSLPKLDSSNSEVRDLIYAGGPDAIGRYWLEQGADGWRLDVGGDVDPGVLVDPANTYWEEFRAALHLSNPEAYITGEEWNIAASWLLGNEWDAVMNYQFSSAVLGFWREAAFFDNDHNPGSSAGVIEPLMPSQFDERILNLAERYPAEALYAMMNLLGSHDTNRALFMLDHEAALGTDPSPLLQSDYDWSDAIQRLKGVALLQMTMPGAPTIYYGDEVGLVGPVYYDANNNTWQDDPYNRQPFPWLDETGTPFYLHLQTEVGQAELLDHYKLLTAARNDHPALRTGSYDPLLLDDPNLILAYGRKLTGAQADAAVIIANRQPIPVTQSVTLDVSGYLPVGAVLLDILTSSTYTVTAGGELTVPAVPALSGAVLVLESGDVNPLPAITDLAITNEANAEISLGWSAVAGADSYRVYRSALSGGGYTLLDTITATTYTDTGLINGQTYYYVVEPVDDDSLLTGGLSNEASGVPHYIIGWANLQWPPTINHTIAITPTENIYGQVWIDGVTAAAGATPTLWAQVGFGAPDSAPSGWTEWVTAEFNGQAGNNDEFRGQLTPEALGIYDYVYRYSTTNGRDWLYADQNGPIADPDAAAPNPGVLTVTPSADTTAPTAPLNLEVSDFGSDFIELSWEAVTGDPSLYAYDLYRSTVDGDYGAPLARISAPSTVYTDTSVTGGVTYYYAVKALDTSFNFSDFSNQVEGVAEPKVVEVTFRVAVPDYTPGVVYIAGNLPGMPQWNPGATPLTEVAEDVWEITLSLPDGAAIEYKYTRGSWETVENWGTISGLANRSASISYGEAGEQLIDNTATDWGSGPDSEKAVQLWRDPLVIASLPADGAAGVGATGSITLTWSIAMNPNATFVVMAPAGAVSGAYTLNGGTTLVFTPAQPLQYGTLFTISASGQSAQSGDVQQVPFSASFTTQGVTFYLSVMAKQSELKP